MFFFYICYLRTAPVLRLNRVSSRIFSLYILHKLYRSVVIYFWECELILGGYNCTSYVKKWGEAFLEGKFLCTQLFYLYFVNRKKKCVLYKNVLNWIDWFDETCVWERQKLITLVLERDNFGLYI